jgi:uncharacterized protein (UPF0548 family)
MVFDDLEPTDPVIRMFFKEHSDLAEEWLEVDEIETHWDEVKKAFPAAVNDLTESVFHILFFDRNFLFSFQEFLAPFVANLKRRQHRRYSREMEC